jgi:hypothetical protein
MRLWSISPKYLDRQGLLAVWREGLLAKHVLEGKTKGYKNHPQLLRFKDSKDAIIYINNYLLNIYQEAEARGYKFSLEKLDGLKKISKHITVSTGQVAYEFKHLLNKLRIRDTERYKKYKNTKDIEVHNLFEVVAGKIEEWEKIK